MIKLGEFSKLSHLTIKALRFYEKEELLVPAYIDSQTKYRYYNTSQLQLASKIKAFLFSSMCSQSFCLLLCQAAVFSRLQIFIQPQISHGQPF